MKRVGKWWVPDVEELQVPALERGSWQLDHLEAALEHVTDWRCAIDGGAHVGTWTCAMAERFHRVIAFEPAQDTFDCLMLNLGAWEAEFTRTHGLTGSPVIEAHRLAIGERKAKGLGMADDGKYHGGNTGGRYLDGKGDITVTTIDRLKLDALGFLKLDVEGYEVFALRGARKTIERCRPIILIEDKPRMAHRFGLAPHAATTYCEEELGMKVIGNVGADIILGW